MEYKISHILIKSFEEKQNKNSQYSIRAFARDLEIGKSTLHEVLYKNKEISKAMAKKVLIRLDYGEKEINEILDYNYSPESDHLFEKLSEDQFKKISTCEHFAVLSLAKLNSISVNPKELSSRLNINEENLLTILQDLIELKLIKIEKDFICRTSKPLTTTYGLANETIQNYHRETLSKIEKSLTEVSVELREIASTTFLMPPSKINELKEELKAIRRRLVQSVEVNSSGSEAFLINFSLIPLSQGNTHAS